jgi:hypothetical protein
MPHECPEVLEMKGAHDKKKIGKLKMILAV